MKNLRNWISGILGFKKDEKELATQTTQNTPKQKEKKPYFPENIEQLKELAINVSNGSEEHFKILIEYLNYVDGISVEEMRAIYNDLRKSTMKDELADIVCEKAKKDPELFKKLTVGKLGYYFEGLGFYSIIGLFDNKVIETEKSKVASLHLLENVRATNCWRHYESESAIKAYIKYFSFGDGKELLKHRLSSRFLGIIKEYLSKEEAKRLVGLGKMSKELFKKLYRFSFF